MSGGFAGCRNAGLAALFVELALLLRRRFISGRGGNQPDMILAAHIHRVFQMADQMVGMPDDYRVVRVDPVVRAQLLSPRNSGRTRSMHMMGHAWG